jgi:hypothetical protein
MFERPYRVHGLSGRRSRIQGHFLLHGLLAAVLGAFAAKGGDLAAVTAPGTPPPDPRPAPGTIGGSGNGRWQFGTLTGIYVVDPAVGEIAIQGATSGSPAFVVVNLDKLPPPADTTVSLNSVLLVRASGLSASWTVDPAGPQPIVGTGGFITLVAASASNGSQRQLILPCPSDIAMTSTPPIGSSLAGHASVQVAFAASLVLNPPNIPGLAGVFPQATLLGYDPNTGRLPLGNLGGSAVGAGQLGVTVPISTPATTSQYLMDIRWPGLWVPDGDGETGAFCGLAKRWTYLNTSCPAITVAPATIPQGTVSSAYGGVTFTSAGGAAPLSYALTGALPAGMNFNPATATLGGTPAQIGSFPITVTATDGNGCNGSRGYTLTIATQPGVPVAREEIVPVVLKLTGITTFSSELTLANTGSTSMDLTLTYTSEPSIVAGLVPSGGSLVQRVDAGQQLVIGDVIAFLKERGVPVGAEDVGTLRVSYTSTSTTPTVFAQTRTTSPSGIGRAGVGYGAPSTGSLTASRVAIYGLRQNLTDRSNMALLNAGQAGPATFKVTLNSGDPGGAKNIALADVTLQPGEWHQINAVLDGAGLTNGYATVERVSGTAPFVAYGVINDSGTNDGSFLEMARTTLSAEPLIVPAIVETPVFETELTLSNPGATDLVATLSYVESLSAGGVPATPVSVTLLAGEQRIIPRVVDFLRTQNAGIGAPGAGHAGSLRVAFAAAGVPAGGWAGARVTSAAAGGGRYGVSYAGVPPSAAAAVEAFVTGLRQDDATRSNLALVNVGDVGHPVTLSYEVYDGITMQRAGQPVTVTLPPGGWRQFNSVLADFGVSNGYVRVLKVSGDDHFVAYGVVNDGGPVAPGTNDGSVVTMAGAR